MRRYLYLYFTLVAVDPAAFAQTTPKISRRCRHRANNRRRSSRNSADAKTLTNECRRRGIPRSQLRAATLVAVRHRSKRWFTRLTLAT